MGTSTASFDIDARTDRGRQRSNNQDSIGAPIGGKTAMVNRSSAV
jgi:serine/threonine protein phosphatase PrpC